MGLGYARAAWAVVPMPEAAMDRDDKLASNPCDVWLAGDVLPMQPIT